MTEPRRRKPADGPKARLPKGERRRRLVAEAKRLFALQGYPATTLEQVGEAARVTPSVLAKNFPDKPSLLRAVCESFHAAVFAPPEPPADGPPPDATTQLTALTERFLHATQAEREVFQVLLWGLTSTEDMEAAGVVREVVRGMAGAAEPLFREGQQEGMIRRSLDPRQAASDWLRLLLGHALLPPTEPPDGDQPAHVIDCFLHGVLKTDV